MLSKRLIPCLDVRDGKTTKGIKFKNNVDIGDPVEMAKFYYEAGADELVFYDITASHEERDIMLDVVRRVAENIFIPFSVGGGIRTVDDMRAVLLAGAEKVSVNSAAVKNPEIISRGAEAFGAQCVVLGMDVKKVGVSDKIPSGYEMVINGGRTHMGIDALWWAQEGQRLGAGEICLNSIDQDGEQSGYEMELTRLISTNVTIPGDRLRRGRNPGPHRRRPDRGQGRRRPGRLDDPLRPLHLSGNQGSLHPGRCENETGLVMEKVHPRYYFDLETCQFESLFDGIDQVWQGLDRIKPYITERIQPNLGPLKKRYPDLVEKTVVLHEGKLYESGAFELHPGDTTKGQFGVLYRRRVGRRGGGHLRRGLYSRRRRRVAGRGGGRVRRPDQGPDHHRPPGRRFARGPMFAGRSWPPAAP